MLDVLRNVCSRGVADLTFNKPGFVLHAMCVWSSLIILKAINNRLMPPNGNSKVKFVTIFQWGQNLTLGL